MGLGPLAIYLAELGFAVSGEDDAMAAAMRAQLERAGVTLTATGAVPAGAQLVVISSAIKPGNAALAEAVARGLPVVKRGELLAEVTRDLKVVAVCGSHGKTTTTAMLVAALQAEQFPAGFVLGGLWADTRLAPARAGAGEWVVVEVDESDGTIARFTPEITVLVNLDWDHPDHYRRLEKLEDTFRALLERTREAVLWHDACARSTRLVPQGRDRVRSWSFGRTGDFTGLPVAAGRLRLGGAFSWRDEMAVRTRGEFNFTNATAALAAAQVMGATLAAETLAEFPGVHRRQAVLLAEDGLTVIEDYAHHPAEIRALLDGLREERGGRLVAVFQPHRFSRTAQFRAEFAAALTLADAVYLIDVYGAGETPVEGGTTADLYAEMRRRTPELPVVYRPGDTGGLLAALSAGAARGDCVVFVGAGDIEQHARDWLVGRGEAAVSAGAWEDAARELRGRLSAAAVVRRDEALASKTTMRVGGPARVYVEPDNVADLQATLRWVNERGLRLEVLGRGSNLVVPETGVDGVVVSLRRPGWESFTPLADGRVRVGAGLRLKNLCGLATKAGLAGFEFLEGIPGNVGGALRMNAGAMGGWMFDVVEEVEVMARDGEVTTLRREAMHVDYRHCAELQTAIALTAVLRPAAASEATEIGRQIDVYRDKRQKSQPREPSAGCIFKNPPNDSAGRLIDACGLKGARVGDAEVSMVHANFIVNRGEASGDDVIALVRQVRAAVAAQTGVTLEPEVMLYGTDWRNVL
jgi:UDP-N-acetylmuramate--L-alanine ligase/UDP-N-acetylenolpyruvoylglucosamine reductase